MKRRIISLFFSVILICLFTPSAFSANDASLEAANALYKIGLFNGTGTDANGDPIFDLDREPTRHEAVTMLVRLLGKESEALSKTWEIPFTDVADWAKPYVGYAYANGLTSGTSSTTYSGDERVSASQYLTFVLRAFGYESGKDFQWDKAWELSDQIGLTNGEYNEDTTAFMRGDVAVVSYRAHELQQILLTAPYWGLPADIKFIAQPSSIDELDNNVLYSFLIGNYSLNFDRVSLLSGGLKLLSSTIQGRIKPLSLKYPALVGVFSNADVECVVGNDNCMVLNFPEASLSMESIFGQQTEVLRVAINIKDTLYSQGKITDDMSEKQIAFVYYNYLNSLNMKPGGGSAAAKLGKSVEYDSPYACLVNKKADCVGRAGTFNLLMHLEGISAQGVGGKIKGIDSGHLLSQVVLDGELYYCDWMRKIPPTQNIDSWFEFDE